MLKQVSIISDKLSTLWGNADSYTGYYIFATALFLLSMLSQNFNLIIDHGVSAPGHGREVVDGLDSSKTNLFQLMSNVQIPGEKFMTQRCKFTLQQIPKMLV